MEIKDSEGIHNDNKDPAVYGKASCKGTLSRFCDILVKLQDLHDKIDKSTKECEDIIMTVSVGIMNPELSVSALVNRLISQIGYIRRSIERCSHYSESLAKEITHVTLTTAASSRAEDEQLHYNDCQSQDSGSSPKNKDSWVNVSSPEQSDHGSQETCESQESERGSSKKDLSWDNFESDQAFLQFKSSMDKVLKELGDMENAQIVLKKKKKKKRKQTDDNRGQVQGLSAELQGYQGGIVEKCFETDRVIEILSQVVDESNARWLRKTKQLFNQLETSLLGSVDSQIKHAMKTCTQHQHTGIPIAPVHDEQAHLEDQDACQRLEVIKSKLNEVQKLVKLLSAKADIAENEKEKALSRIDALSSHMINLESDHEIRCKELEEDLKTASDMEISLQRKCSSLQQEKDDKDKEMKANTRQLHQKELELLKMLKKIRKVQAEYEKTETALKNDNEELRRKNSSIWRDYEKVSSELEDKDKELKSLMDSMKNTEHSLLSLFNTIGNIDDFLQRAREMNLFHE